MYLGLAAALAAWYNMSTWRIRAEAKYEVRASNTWPLSECEREAKQEVRGHGKPVLQQRVKILIESR